MTAANLPTGAARSSLERVHTALDAADRRPKRTRDHIQAGCPLHEDRKPSLSIDWKSDRGGITRLHCHSCQASERDLLEAVGLTLPDRFDQPLEPKRSPPRGTVAPQGNRLGPLPKRITADPAPAPDPEVSVERHLARTYDYVDEDGDLLYQVLRYEWVTAAGRDKNFEQRRPDGKGGWIPRAGDRKVLRHLPAVRAAIADGRQVWLAEGEKDDEALNRALPRDQGVATSHSGGAGNFGELTGQLQDAHVVVVVDLDPAGYRRAGEITHKLRGVAASVTTVLPAVGTAHADAADHLESGHGIGEFVPVTDEQVAALVAEAQAQEAAKRAEEQARRVQVCLLEARAQLEASRQAARRGAVAAARDTKRYALRWAHEAIKTATRVADAAEQVWQRQQQVQKVPLPVPLTPEVVLGRAEQAQRTAQRLAGQAWDEVGEARPAPVQQSLTAPTPSERHPNTADADAGAAALPAPTPLPARPASGDRPDGPPAEVVPFPGGRSGGGSGGGSDRIEAVRATYERLDGHGLYEIKTDRGGNQVRHEVLSLDVRITGIEVLEAGPDATSRDGIPFVVPQSVASYVITYTHPLTRERLTQRIEGDRAGTCEWLGDLGVMVEYDSSSKGRARVWDAIRSTSKDARMVTIHESTGWRELPEVGWTYLHAGGGITADGSVEAMVRLPGAIDRIELPDPIRDPRLLRQMFDRDSRALMSRLPGYAGAVLAGTAYRAVLGTTRSSTCLFGTPGTYKSAVAALTMHHFGVRWERSGATTSMSGHGATVNALPELWWHAKDALFFGDDFAPDKSVEAAGSFLSTVARMQYNQEVRSRVNMRLRGGRGGVQQGYVTRTTLLLTSEVKATADSGNQRLAVVDLAKGEVDLAEIIALDRAESRMGRATVMASLLAWIARDQPAHVARAEQRARLAAERRRGEGMSDRIAEPLGELEAGWDLIGDWLVDIGAYTERERAEMLTQVRASLTEAGHRSLDPDSPTSVGERVRRLLGTCLRSGVAHVTGVGGYPPAEPEALRLGWRRVVGLDDRVEPRGDHIGVITRSVHGSRLHLDPEGTMAVILAVARKSGEPLPVTKTVVQRELAVAGILRTEHDGRSVRYTVPVPDPAGCGGQVRRWDLDVDRIFRDPEPPTPTDPATPPTPTGPVGPDSYPAEPEEPDDDPTLPVDPFDGQITATDEVPMNRDQLEQFRAQGQLGVARHPEEEGPCEVCGSSCCLTIAGHLVHYACALSAGFQITDGSTRTQAAETPQQTDPAPPPAAVPSPVQQPAPPRPTASPRPATRRGSGWKRSVAVIDASGIYLPDGPSSDGIELDGIDTIGMIGESLDVGHVAAPGLLVLTQSALDKLGVMPDGKLLTDPGPDGQPATEDDVSARLLDHLGAHQQVLVSRDGWTVDGGRLMPWTVIRRGDRALRLILEPFVWIWDRRGDSPSPFTDLPDPDTDPAACWVELARRLDRLAELLGTPWSTSAGITGAALFDQIQRRRDRRGGRVLDAAGVVPDLAATGQHQLENELAWPAAAHDRGDRPIRPIGQGELDAAVAVHWYDRRGSYLAPAGGADLPVGEPGELEAAEAAAMIAEHRWGKLPVGLWQITLPAWDEQQLPPPHPDQRRYGPVTRWVTSPTLRLLLDDQDAGGVGYTPEDLQIGPAWIWPESGRLLEPWYRQLREALLAARQQEPQGGPISRAIKGVYTGYIGRMDSDFAARSARPWHHQPVWRAVIIASARSGLWRVLRRHQLTTGRTPIQVHIDEVAYLSADTDPTVNPPAEDTGALGKLKVSASRVLTEPARTALVKGGRVNDERTWSVDEPAARTP